MNDEFDQDIIYDEVSGDEPLISHDHSNRNNYSSQRNNNQRSVHGNNLGQRRRNTANNNPLSRNGNKGIKNVAYNRLGRNNGLFNSYSNQKGRHRGNKVGNSSSSNVSENTSNKNKTSNFMNSLSGSSLEETEDKIKIKIPLSLKIKIIISVVAILLVVFGILFVCAVFVAIFSDGASSTQNIYTDSKLQENNYCSELEVTFYKKVEENGTTEYVINEEVGENGVATYDLETYIAGVVTGEVGIFNNEETLKALAVAARTYVLHHTSEGNCKVNSWDNFQVMSPSISSKGRKAANDTKGEVLLDTEGKLINSQYDAFACYEKTDEYYRLKQKGMLIPIKWVEENFPNLNSKWTSCTMQDAHGNGMSQYGALYMAEYYNYTYHDLLNYFYDDQIETFFCTYEEVEGSCDPNDTDCEPEYEKVCE